MSHRRVVAEENRCAFPTQRICEFQCSEHLSWIIAILDFDHFPPRCFCETREVGSDCFGGHVGKLNVIPVAVHDEISESQFRCQAECLHHLSFLRISISHEHIHFSRLFKILETESKAESVRDSFAKRAKTKRNIADAGFHMSGKALRNTEIVDNCLRGLEPVILPVPSKQPLESIGKKREMSRAHAERLIFIRLSPLISKIR